MDNPFFSKYKIKALCRDYITFLARMKGMQEGSKGFQSFYELVQVAIPISCIQSVTEIPDGVQISAVEGRYTRQYIVPEAHIKMASIAIAKAQNFVYREQDEWTNQ